MELRKAKEQGVATIVERNKSVTGYATGIGLFGHAVAKSNEDLKALISNSSKILGPGFFVPARNHELMNWLLYLRLLLMISNMYRSHVQGSRVLDFALSFERLVPT
jgi:hypothetical protein